MASGVRGWPKRAGDALMRCCFGWRLLPTTVGLSMLAYGVLHVGPGFYREARYEAYREQFGDLRLWGAVYLAWACILLLPARLPTRPRWSRSVWYAQNLTMLLVSGWLIAMIGLIILGAMSTGGTPAGWASLPWPVYVFLDALADIYQDRVSEHIPAVRRPRPAGAREDGG